MAGFLEVLSPGPLATLQDLGRPGYAHVGVGPAGAADRGAHALANRIVGNETDQATIEVLLGGLALQMRGFAVLAVAGAPAPVTINGRAADHHSPLYLADGDVIRLGTPPAGLRSYVAVAGGIAEPPVLGSRAWDSMARIGPEPLAPGKLLPIGEGRHHAPNLGVVPTLPPTLDPVMVALIPGPRDAWIAGGVRRLTDGHWTVSVQSDRVGVRLEGDPLTRARGFADRELPSEGTVRGAIQVPPSGLPVVFGADHPVTGGYPVVGVLREIDSDRLAQARPGQQIVFTTRPTN
ncbi:MAG: biotin-dependent carboxyltransferase family protein [Propioniciclava sp.]|uniref:5-oxoprolinase subunit C family protein n=1 Tax=Propioniciclava sp. TaxID=2038686 RepID=UPI0039E5BB0D